MNILVTIMNIELRYKENIYIYKPIIESDLHFDVFCS